MYARVSEKSQQWHNSEERASHAAAVSKDKLDSNRSQTEYRKSVFLLP